MARVIGSTNACYCHTGPGCAVDLQSYLGFILASSSYVVSSEVTGLESISYTSGIVNVHVFSLLLCRAPSTRGFHCSGLQGPGQ